MAISVSELEAQLSDVPTRILRQSHEQQQVDASASPRQIFQNYKGMIPAGVRGRLAATMATGDRSKVLWKLSCSLLEAGLSPGEVVVLLEPSVWNKFGADRSRLWADVNKALVAVSSNGSTPKEASKPKGHTPVPRAVPLDQYLAVDSRDPQWMIEGLWSDKSHGIIAGEPKTRKSYVAIDIALSVATGTDCLGHFKVLRPGPVLMIQEEISDAEMRKRLRYIAASKDLAGEVHIHEGKVSVHLPAPVPLYLRNRQQIDLSDEDTFRAIHKEVVEKDISLVILDPLQLMLGHINENNAHEVRPILYNFLQLKEETGTGIMILHHYAKTSATNPRQGGQRMLGSQAFHGWVESALYLSKNEKYATEVEREFRNFDPFPDFTIDYFGGNERYEVQVSEDKPPPRKAPPTKFERFCMDNEGAPLKAFAKHFGKSTDVLKRQIQKSSYLVLKEEATGTSGRPRLVVEKA